MPLLPLLPNLNIQGEKLKMDWIEGFVKIAKELISHLQHWNDTGGEKAR